MHKEPHRSGRWNFWNSEVGKRVISRLKRIHIDGQVLRRLGLSLLAMAALTTLLAVSGVWAGAWMAAGMLAAGGVAAYIYAPHAEAHHLVRQAKTLISGGQFRLALRSANRALELVPYLASAFVVRSAVYAGLGQIDMAVDDAEQAVQVAPTQPEARLARARLYSYRGLHEDAIRDLQVGLRERPNWVAGYFEMAQLYVKLQDYERSLATLNRLRENTVPPWTRYDAMILMGWVYEEKLKDLDRAIASYTRAIPILPERKIGYLRRAFAYRSRGDMEQAAEDLLRAAQQVPTPEDAGQYHWLRAVCYGRRYTITGEDRDMQAWLEALESSIREDAPNYQEQSRQALEALNGKSIREFPPRVHYYPN